MALIISCDVINNDLVVKLYIFILYLNLCNIFRWDNFLYGKDFYIERIYYQIKLYIYCLVFLVFLMIYRLPFPVTFHWRNYLKLTKTNFVSNIHGIYMEHVWGEYSTVQSSCKIQKIWRLLSVEKVQYSQVIKFRTVASFCVLRISTTDGTDDQIWFDQ